MAIVLVAIRVGVQGYNCIATLKSTRQTAPDNFREITEIINDHESSPKRAAALDRARTHLRIKLSGIPPLTKEGRERMEAAARVRNDSRKYPEIRELPELGPPDD